MTLKTMLHQLNIDQITLSLYFKIGDTLPLSVYIRQFDSIHSSTIEHYKLVYIVQDSFFFPLEQL